jgi:threonine dehydratase
MNVHQAVLEAEQKIRPYILETPLEYSPWLSQETGAQVWLKLEHLQRTGSFKLRGAANKLLSLTPEQKERGVITASTGNHGTGLAHIAAQLGVKATVFLPKTTAPAKVAGMKVYGVELRYHGQDCIESERQARLTASQQNIPFVSPYNDPEIIAGQGTIGLELSRQIPDMDAVFVPVGGGGLVSGIAGFLKTEKPSVQVIGCQPFNSAVMYESVKAGEILDLESLPTLSDGTAGGLEENSITFAMCQRWVDDFVLLTEEEIADALRFLLEKHYYLIEGAAGLSVAAIKKQAEPFQGKKVVLILCGRKLGMDTLRKLLQTEQQNP